MKKYSNTYPLVFGIIFLLTGIVFQQVAIAVIFGVLPIVAAVLMKLSDRKKKQAGQETDTEKLNRLYRQHNSMSAKNKPHTVPYVDNYVLCVQCKRFVVYSQISVFNKNNICINCAQQIREKLRTVERTEASGDKKIHAQQLVDILSFVTKENECDMEYESCNHCHKRYFREKLVFVDGMYYCKYCFETKYINNENNHDCQGGTPCQIGYKIEGMVNQAIPSTVISIAERLMLGGFDFCRANMGVGTEMYRISYDEYDAFKVSAAGDLGNLVAGENGGSAGELGNVCSPYICAYLKRSTLKVQVVAREDYTIIRWFDDTDKRFPSARVFVNAINEDVYENKCTVSQTDNVDTNDDCFAI